MLETKESNGVLVVKFKETDRFNSLIMEPVKENLLSLYKTTGVKLALDLSGIKFIDSSGFNVMLMVMKTASRQQGQFKICNVSTEVKELFEVLQLHNVFEMYGTLEECLESF